MAGRAPLQAKLRFHSKSLTFVDRKKRICPLKRNGANRGKPSTPGQGNTIVLHFNLVAK